MENVVSARRLRKSVLNSIGEVDLNLYNLNKSKISSEKLNREKIYDIKKNDKVYISFKTKLIIKIFCCSLILFLVIFSRMFFLEKIRNNRILVKINNHYITDFSKENVLGKIEYRILKLNLITGDIIPNKIKTKVKNIYFGSIKSYILSFNLKSDIKNIFSIGEKNTNEKQSISENKTVEVISSENKNVSEEVLNGVGGAEPLENKTEEVSSSISVMDMDIELIKSKNISIIKPVNGVVTSRYGVRQEIFANVNPYHTGIDIANKKYTEIISATKGIITKVEFNNKYYGNFVEVTENETIFKYAHLDSINVKQGDSINQKDKIGLMGSTGMSTGPHLHFEIRINNRTVNPEEVLSF